MGKATTLNLIFLILFTANQAFAVNFYFEKVNNKSNEQVILGDLNFTYSFDRDGIKSKEIFEKDSLRIYVERVKDRNSAMVVEKKTRLGNLYLSYKANGNSWENTGVSFRKYKTFYKDIANNECTPNTPTTNNKIDITTISQGISKDKESFASIIFEKSCAENLSKDEFSHLVDGTFKILNGSYEELGKYSNPQILACVQISGKTGQLYLPFKALRKQVELALNSPNASIDEVRANTLTPFPITCNFNEKASQKCGATQEGPKNKISINTACLKKDPKKLQEKAQETIIHEFAHTIRSPKSFTEDDVKGFEKGHCDTAMDVSLGFGVTSVSQGETDLSKNKSVAEANAKSTGAKTLAGDVANPYSSFTERATTPPQATTVATNDSSSGAIEVGGGSKESVSSYSATQQRSIASTNSMNASSSSNYSVNTSIPTLQQQAQYQNVKSYVDTSVGVVAKKIAPIVTYVESPAFANTLPPSSFEAGNSGETNASVGTATTAAKSAAMNRAASATGRSGEVASGASSGGSGEVARSNSADLGSSSSGSSRSPAAVNKSAGRLSSDSGLDNAYALKVRKKLLSDNAYRTELRNKGVQIEFADGYKFETPGHTVLYTEKNGVLVGGK